MELALWNGRQRPAHGSSDSFLLFFVYCEEEQGQEWKQGRSWMNKQNTKESGYLAGPRLAV